ncbi:hypothetical protein ACFL5T_00975 [Gemmatimonadota bacterium]
MKTFARPRQLVDNPQYERDRELMLASLGLETIDEPMRELVAGFAKLPYCFTLQSCYGHFVHALQPQPDNLNPLPAHDVGPIKYRVAYLALCLENSIEGRRLRSALGHIPAIDPEYVQFGSPEWFWNRHLNSYALQVEPTRFLDRDVVMIEYNEALRVEQVRHLFFAQLSTLL